MLCVVVVVVVMSNKAKFTNRAVIERVSAFGHMSGWEVAGEPRSEGEVVVPCAAAPSSGEADQAGQEDVASPSPSLPCASQPSHTLPSPTLPSPSQPIPTLPSPSLPSPSQPSPTLPSPSLPSPGPTCVHCHRGSEAGALQPCSVCGRNAHIETPCFETLMGCGYSARRHSGDLTCTACGGGGAESPEDSSCSGEGDDLGEASPAFSVASSASCATPANLGERLTAAAAAAPSPSGATTE